MIHSSKMNFCMATDWARSRLPLQADSLWLNATYEEKHPLSSFLYSLYFFSSENIFKLNPILCRGFQRITREGLADKENQIETIVGWTDRAYIGNSP